MALETWPVEPVAAIALSLTLLVSSVTDLENRRIPNPLTGTAAVVAVLMAGLGLSIGLVEAVVVSLLLSLPLGALAALRPEGFGMGDVKLVGVMALFMGWEVWLPLVAGLAGASILGLAVAVVRKSAPSSVSLPLAPFLAIATVPFLAVAIS